MQSTKQAMKKAVILLSGGLDSATTLVIALRHGYDCYALSFDYGQRHVFELGKAKKLSQLFKVSEHKIIKIDLRAFGSSALTSSIVVPKGRSQEEIGEGIPITYVPARNTIFLSYALAWAEVLKANTIFIGVNALDYSGYPDCRPQYIEAYEKMAHLATKTGAQGSKIQIKTPLIHLTKAEIIKKGFQLGLDFSLTHSCYDPSEKGYPCQMCDSCLLRKKGFEEAQMVDPILVVREE